MQERRCRLWLKTRRAARPARPAEDGSSCVLACATIWPVNAYWLVPAYVMPAFWLS